MQLDYPCISPATLVKNLEEFADSDDVDIYLSDIREAGEALIAYADQAEPVVLKLAEIRNACEAEEEGA